MIPVVLATKIAATIPNARTPDPGRSAVGIVPSARDAFPAGSVSVAAISSAEIVASIGRRAHVLIVRANCAIA